MNRELRRIKRQVTAVLKPIGLFFKRVFRLPLPPPFSVLPVELCKNAPGNVLSLAADFIRTGMQPTTENLVIHLWRQTARCFTESGPVASHYFWETEYHYAEF
ncbi:MAG: hypothetical protein IT260_23845 [Saprospiraceae bacterium]|nr:hypothetical protein [Saprospiraceae bacterium]